MTAGFAFINVDPNLYSDYAPYWAAPAWAMWILWTIVHGLQGYAVWAVQDIQGAWTYRLTLYVVYLGLSALWPVFFFPAVKRKLRPMMWVTVAITVSCLGLSGFLIWAFWDINTLSGVFMIPSTVWLVYVLLLTFVTVMKANDMDVGDMDRKPSQRGRNRDRGRDTVELGSLGRNNRNKRRRRATSRIPRCERGRTHSGDMFFGVKTSSKQQQRGYCSSDTGSISDY